ncbi:IQ domain-containing protein E isoform X5 [Elephas maximus indicus]|uniref:IQ domain-containing protein E isoform X5 n=1 Tax=Elephas maximus indicus TaxID=99487 RepID=UPI00211651DF|nr:IQ domain-containing protein E isoform X5 [Elephas maximus indicus]
MSLGTGEPASETGDDSLSAITFDSDFETKTKRKSVHKPPPTSPKSPYYSKPRNVASWRSLRTAGSMPLTSRMSLTPQKLWLGTSKQGSLTQPLKPDLTWEQAWTSPPSCTSDYLTEALRMRRSNLRRSASNGHVPGTPVYREKEDMYDEIIELKKVVNGLKQRILKLEQQCKEKDNTINKLQTDIKTTNLEEMRIAMETYYEEIHRLQTLLASSEATGKKLPMEKKVGLKRQKKVSNVLLNLTRSVQELTEENQSLKEDLDRLLSNSPTVPKIRGYVEWSKPRLLRRITELEKKISSLESPNSHSAEPVKASSVPHSSSSSMVHRQPHVDHQEECERLRGVLKSLKGERTALHTQLLDKDLEVKQLLRTKADLEKELEHVKESEKERRGREETLREQVQTLTAKLQELEEAKKEEKDDLMEIAHETQEDLRPPTATSVRSWQDSEDNTSAAHSRPPSACSAETREDERRDAAARVLQAQWRACRHKKKEAVLDEAAVVLQAAFRGHLVRAQLLARRACGSPPPSTPSPPLQPRPPTSSVKRQDVHQESLEFRAHHQHPATPSSQRRITPDSAELEKAVTLVQSVFRAHLARTRPGAPGQRTATEASAKKTSASTVNRDASSPPSLAASPVQDDSEASTGETVEESAAEEEALTPGEPAVVEPKLSRSQPSLSRMPPGLSGSQPEEPPPVDEVHSDDSDDVVISPSLPGKKSSAS